MFIATAIITTGLLTWTGDSLDVLHFEMAERAPVTVHVWGEVEGQVLLPYYEIVDSQGNVDAWHGGHGVCAIGWGGCSYSNYPLDPGAYTFYGWLDGLDGATYNRYHWDIEAARFATPQAAVSVPVPEPAPYALAFAGLLALAAVSLRKGAAL